MTSSSECYANKKITLIFFYYTHQRGPWFFWSEFILKIISNLGIRIVRVAFQLVQIDWNQHKLNRNIRQVHKAKKSNWWEALYLYIIYNWYTYIYRYIEIWRYYYRLISIKLIRITIHLIYTTITIVDSMVERNIWIFLPYYRIYFIEYGEF